VVIQPAISVTTDSGPAATAAASTHRGSSRPGRRNRRYRYTSPSKASSVPIPTIVWNEIRTTLTGG
jgi:hypothetical protein